MEVKVFDTHEEYMESLQQAHAQKESNTEIMSNKWELYLKYLNKQSPLIDHSMLNISVKMSGTIITAGKMSLNDLQTAVNGNIELFTETKTHVVYINDRGAINGSIKNVFATNMLGFVIYGDMIAVPK